MQVKLFTIPVNSVEDYNYELNKFLATNKIVEIEKHLIQNGTHYSWCFYITYTHGDTKLPFSEPKVDYKKVLPPPAFNIFETLREIRAKIAKLDDISAFIVFSNKELAKISELPEITLEGIKSIKGIGNNKIENYAERLIEMYNKEAKSENAKEPEKQEKNEKKNKSDSENSLFR